jgi:hypothetical protein
VKAVPSLLQGGDRGQVLWDPESQSPPVIDVDKSHPSIMRRRTSGTGIALILNAVLLLFQLHVAEAVYFQGHKIQLTIDPILINASTQTIPTATLTCRCSTAIKSVAWRKDSVEIPSSELQSNNSRYSSYFDPDSGIAGFVIRSPQSKDSGTYDCRALVNGSHVTSLAAKVTITSSKQSTTGYGVVRGLDVQVQCPVENTIPSRFPVFWSKDNDELLSGKKYQHSNTRKMTIVGADYKDTGTYHCLVMTPEGTKDAQLRVIVHGPPKPPTQLSLIHQTLHQDCSEVQWTRPQFDGNSRIKQYNLTCKDQDYSHTFIKTCSGDKTSMTVSGLKSGIHYHCNLQAINDLGCSNYSNVVFIFCIAETDNPTTDRNRRFSTNSSWTPAPPLVSDVPGSSNATGILSQ